MPAQDIGQEKIINANYKLAWVTGLLVTFAIAATLTRLSLSSAGNFPAGDSTWFATLEAKLMVPESGTLVKVSPPWDTRHARLYGQSQFHPGFRQRRARQDKLNRDIVLVSERSGEFSINIRFDLHVSHLPRALNRSATAADSKRANFLLASPGINPEKTEVRQIIERFTADNPEPAELVRRLFDYVSEMIRISPNGSDDGNATLKNRRGTKLGVTRALITLLRAAHLPARSVIGLDLSINQEKQPGYWLETFYDDGWRALDVVAGHYQELPSSYIPLRKGKDPLIQIDNGLIRSLNWVIHQAETPRGLLASDKPQLLSFLDLTQLAPATREILALLLLLPLGALSTEVLRQIGGIRTFGTFTPTLLALAVVFVDWKTALIVFTLVTVLGIAGRSLLPEIIHSRVARLSVVFTLVALLMSLVVSFLTHLNPSLDSSVVLLPTVILTMLIDRIYSVADENGLRTAIIRLGWTIVAALLAFILLLQIEWGAFLLAFPELHALTIASIILLGRYQGIKASQLTGLSWLSEPKKKVVRRDIRKTSQSSSQDNSVNSQDNSVK